MKTAEEKRELMDSLIEKHLHKFGEVVLFRASLDSFRETGKVSGSFYLALKELMDDYKNQSQPIEKEQRITIYEQALNEWKDQCKNQEQEIERLRDSASRKDEMLTMAADAYKDLLLKYKELEAQLEELEASTGFKRVESSHIEQPEEDKEVHFLEGMINQLDKIIKEEETRKHHD